MLFLLIAFCCGAIILYCDDSLLAPLGFILVLLSLLFSVQKKIRVLLAITLAISSLFLSYQAINDGVNSRLSALNEGKEFFLEGYFCSLVRSYERYASADFCVLKNRLVNETALTSSNQTFFEYESIKKVRLTWTLSQKKIAPSGVIRLKAKLKRPKASHNFVGFSYEQYLFYKGIGARGHIKEFISKSNIKFGWVDEAALAINTWRVAYIDYLSTRIASLTHQGVVQALLSGDKSRMSADERAVLTDTGTLHLVAISGLHVGIVMFGLWRIFKRKYFRLTTVVIAGLIYVVAVGFSESAQRAWIMTSAALLMLDGRFSFRAVSGYFCACAFVLCFDPLAPLNSGFWYSFVAVLILISWFALKRGKQLDKSDVQFDQKQNAYPLIGQLVQLQLALCAGLLVLNSLFDVQVGLSSVLANVIAVPWVTLLVLPLAAIALGVSLLSESISTELFYLVDASLHILLEYLRSSLVIDLPFNLLNSSTGLFALMAVLVFIFTLRVMKRPTGILIAVVLLVSLLPLKNPKNDEVIVFDSGQGLAIGLFWDDQAWLYDTGEHAGGFSVVNGAIRPYLDKIRRRSQLDGLILSHGDSDHASGKDRVFDLYSPEKIWAGEVSRLGLSDSFSCHSGMNWEVGARKRKGQLKVLYPFQNDESHLSDSSNNQSCVVRFEYDGLVFLLMGDLEGQAERRLIARYKKELKADVLIAGHHGSKHATSYGLLKYVKPRYVVTSSGYMNRFGHPHASVLERVKRSGAITLNTADTGAIRFDLNDKGRITMAREERGAPWFYGRE